MSGSRMKITIEAMSLFMQSLPSDCYYNIVGFGTNYEMVHKTPVKYDKNTLNYAKEHI